MSETDQSRSEFQKPNFEATRVFDDGQQVVVTAGPNEGESGRVVALVTSDPEPTYYMETTAGHDVLVTHSELEAR